MKNSSPTPLPKGAVAEPLPRQRRRFLFLSLLTLFVCAVPIFAFYATGYRYDFFSPDASITATGGMYLSVPHDTSEVYINDETVQDSRLFRQALYIQNLLPGVHRVHVQAAGYHTWVKELPVYPHIVTEGSAFQLPEVPLLRPISPYLTSTGSPLYVGVASTTDIAPFASTTLPMTATTTKATSTLAVNPEYAYVASLFATTSATSTQADLLNRVVDEAKGIFTPIATSTATTTLATTTIISNNTMLFEKGDDVFVRYLGTENSIPYYFCVPEPIVASSSERYEAQVIAARLAYAEERGLTEIATSTTERLCRREIKIDRQWQEVVTFNFYPNSTDLVLMHRKDGVFVTEVDDRAWQNTQSLYPASATGVVVDGGRIFIQDHKYLFEVITELPEV